MSNTCIKKPPLTLRPNTPSYVLVCAAYEKLSKAEWAISSGCTHMIPLSNTRNNKAGIMLSE